jgi:hypothetical protein
MARPRLAIGGAFKGQGIAQAIAIGLQSFQGGQGRKFRFQPREQLACFILLRRNAALRFFKGTVLRCLLGKLALMGLHGAPRHVKCGCRGPPGVALLALCARPLFDRKLSLFVVRLCSLRRRKNVGKLCFK